MNEKRHFIWRIFLFISFLRRVSLSKIGSGNEVERIERESDAVHQLLRCWVKRKQISLWVVYPWWLCVAGTVFYTAQHILMAITCWKMEKINSSKSPYRNSFSPPIAILFKGRPLCNKSNTSKRPAVPFAGDEEKIDDWQRKRWMGFKKRKTPVPPPTHTFYIFIINRGPFPACPNIDFSSEFTMRVDSLWIMETI